MENWQVWLNRNTNFIPKNQIVGKNIIYNGNQETIYISDNITVIGYGKIYNEEVLYEKLQIPKNIHSLQIFVELYKKYGFEDMLELLEGDFSFILLDYNIHGEESWLFIARDPFGIYPLYYYENQSNDNKKVQFDFETKHYGFSSSGYSDKYNYKSFIAGNHQRFSHSYKVSANWKLDYQWKSYFNLPFFSILNDPQEENKPAQFKCAIEKRMKWIYYKNPTISKQNVGVLCLSPDHIGLNGYLEINPLFELTSINPLNIQNENKSVIFEWSKIITCTTPTFNSKTNVMLQIEYIENEYPTIITRLKTILNSNDPYTIRSHFIPMILAKYISENMSEMKHVFLAEPFTYDWIEKTYLDRRKRVSELYLDENMKGWTQIFLEFGIDLYMPFLDRILMQNIQPCGFV